MLGQLSVREKYFLGGVIVLLLAVISLPYLWAWAVTPQGYRYSGLLYNPDDQNVHLAWARQALEGHWAISDLFTSESLNPQNSALFVNLYTLAVGGLARLTHLPLIWASHIFRLLFAALAMVWFYDLCSQLTDSRRTRCVALMFAAFSCGVGFLLPLLPGHILVDRPDLANFPMMPEAYIFTSAFIFGLNITSLALLVLVYGQLLRAEKERSWKHVAVAAVAAFLLANIHTYDAIPLLVVLAIWLVWRLIPRKSTFTAGALPAVIISTLLPVIYQWWVFKNDDQFRLKAVTYTAAPPFMDMLLSYGVVFLLAVVGVAMLCRHWRQMQRLLFLVAWVTVTFAVIYVPRILGHPLSFERKMIEGVHWPLCLLAAFGLGWCLEKIQYVSIKNIITAGVIMISCISSMQFIGWCLQNAQDNNSSRANVLMPPLYLSAGDQDAMNYLQEHGNRHKAVLCLTFAGNYVPGQTGMPVYLGHWAETIEYKEKLSQTLQFFTGKMPEKAAAEWLQQNHIGYVLIGSYEHQLGAAMPLPLKPVFTKGETMLYEVR